MSPACNTAANNCASRHSECIPKPASECVRLAWRFLYLRLSICCQTEPRSQPSSVRDLCQRQIWRHARGHFRRRARRRLRGRHDQFAGLSHHPQCLRAAVYCERRYPAASCFFIPNCLNLPPASGYLTEVNPTGTGLIYSSYFSGTQTDSINFAAFTPNANLSRRKRGVGRSPGVRRLSPAVSAANVRDASEHRCHRDRPLPRHAR